jgi:hypothetical protein
MRSRDIAFLKRARLFLEKVIQGGFGSLNFGSILCDVSTCLRFEVVAKVSLVFLPYLFGRRLLAMFRIADVVLDAHLAHVQFRVARLAHIEAPQWQAQGS